MGGTANQIKNFIIDVDGVMTDGTFTYTADGKTAKVFGSDDSDGLALIKDFVNIHFITGDKRGYPITEKRIKTDMKMKLDQVSTIERADWIEAHYGLNESIYMGDGIFDAMVFDRVAYAIAPSNAIFLAKEHADHVTKASGGHGAVAEACFHIAEKFFEPLDPLNLKLNNSHSVWDDNN